RGAETTSSSGSRSPSSVVRRSCCELYAGVGVELGALLQLLSRRHVVGSDHFAVTGRRGRRLDVIGGRVGRTGGRAASREQHCERQGCRDGGNPSSSCV